MASKRALQRLQEEWVSGHRSPEAIKTSRSFRVSKGGLELEESGKSRTNKNRHLLSTLLSARLWANEGQISAVCGIA